MPISIQHRPDLTSTTGLLMAKQIPTPKKPQSIHVTDMQKTKDLKGEPTLRADESRDADQLDVA